MKGKDKLRNCHRLEKAKETRHLGLKKKKKDISRTIFELGIRLADSLFYISVNFIILTYGYVR